MYRGIVGWFSKFRLRSNRLLSGSYGWDFKVLEHIRRIVRRYLILKKKNQEVFLSAEIPNFFPYLVSLSSVPLLYLTQPCYRCLIRESPSSFSVSCICIWCNPPWALSTEWCMHLLHGGWQDAARLLRTSQGIKCSVNDRSHLDWVLIGRLLQQFLPSAEFLSANASLLIGFPVCTMRLPLVEITQGLLIIDWMNLWVYFGLFPGMDIVCRNSYSSISCHGECQSLL